MGNRIFDPKIDRRYGRPTLNPDELTKFSPKWGYCRLRYFPYRGCGLLPQMWSVVISIDGGSRGNHIPANPNSRTAYGVYSGPHSELNRSGLISRHLPQTNNYAELMALKQALNSVKQFHDNDDVFASYSHTIFIKTDSQYLTSCMDEWIWRWIEQGGRKADGRPVKNWELILSIHETICELDSEHDIDVKFWWVDREWNEDADDLVNAAFDRN